MSFFMDFLMSFRGFPMEITLKLNGNIQVPPLLHRRLIEIFRCPENSLGGSAGHIGFAAFRADIGMIGYGLGNDFLIIGSICLGPCMGYVFCLMGADFKSSGFRAKLCGCLKGNGRVIGSILVFPVFAGLAFVGVIISFGGNFPAALSLFCVFRHLGFG